MVIDENSINNIMGGVENTGRVRLHNHKRKLKQRFDLIRKLGQGTYGKVQLGINKETGEEVAIKTIKKSKIETEADLIRIRREIQIMSSVQHPNIIHIYEVFENSDKIVLVMEYAAGGELYDYLSEKKVLTEQEARRLFRQISTAVYYCHKYQICHRDLKLENILLDEAANAKIADFGLSNVFNDQSRLSTFCGSPLYASPEIVKGTPYQGPEVDCWSLGVLLYTLVYGAMPFDGSNFKTLVTQITNSDYFEPPKPSPASTLIKDMLTVCPTKRANIQNICSHWWVNEDYNDNCLDIAKDLATQTPVRLDLLLSLATQLPKMEVLNSENNQLRRDKSAKGIVSTTPTRCHSVGSLMDLDRSNADIGKKLSTNDSRQNVTVRECKDTDMMPTKQTVSPIVEEIPAIDNTQSKTMKPKTEVQSPSTSQPTSVDQKTVDSASPSHFNKVKKVEEKPTMTDKVKKINNNIEKVPGTSNKSPIDSPKKDVKIVKKESKVDKNDVSHRESSTKSPEDSPTHKKVSKDKKISSDKETLEDKTGSKAGAVKKVVNNDDNKKTDSTEAKDSDTEKPAARRRSRIFETAEKFKQLSFEKSESFEKSKQIFIPGVSVECAKKAYERKSSIGSGDTPHVVVRPKSKIIETPGDKRVENSSSSSASTESMAKSVKVESASSTESVSKPAKIENVSSTETVMKSAKLVNEENEEYKKRQEEKKHAVSIITSVIGKPPLLRKSSRSSSTSSECNSISAISIKKTISNDSVTENISSMYNSNKSIIEPTAEVRTENRMIKSDFPSTAEEKRIISPRKMCRSEIIIPNIGRQDSRSFSTSFSKESNDSINEVAEYSPPVRSTIMSSTLPRTRRANKEPMEASKVITKSPREYIIPIAVEGCGYIVPKSNSLILSEENRMSSLMDSRSKFRRFSSLKSEVSSDNDSDTSHPFSSFSRHENSPFNRRMHGLRSTRSSRYSSEGMDSLSSDDDDDGFELLTAENLFSTLLSRVRSLTQRLNMDDNYKFRNSLFGSFDTPARRNKFTSSRIGTD